MLRRASLPRLYLVLSIQSLLISAQSSSEPSGCQVCEATGDCSQAYRGTPGQFCGHWLDRASHRQSCCCPVNAVCRVSNYACNCAVRVSSINDRRDGGIGLLWLWYLLGTIAVVAFCVGGLLCLCRRPPESEDGGVATPVPTAYPASAPPAQSTTYGASDYTPVAPAMPTYAAAPTYSVPAYPVGAPPVRSGMGAGTGAALGGAAGLLGGVLLGEAIADRGDRGYYGPDGGGVYDTGIGDTGGGDYRGDFAGDF